MLDMEKIMAITIKNEHEIALMRESGRLLALVHEEMRKELSEKALALGKPHACEDIYKEILKLTGGR